MYGIAKEATFYGNCSTCNNFIWQSVIVQNPKKNCCTNIVVIRKVKGPFDRACSFYIRLGPVYTKRSRQRRVNSAMTLAVLVSLKTTKTESLQNAYPLILIRAVSLASLQRWLCVDAWCEWVVTLLRACSSSAREISGLISLISSSWKLARVGVTFVLLETPGLRRFARSSDELATLLLLPLTAPPPPTPPPGPGLLL